MATVYYPFTLYNFFCKYLEHITQYYNWPTSGTLVQQTAWLHSCGICVDWFHISMEPQMPGQLEIMVHATGSQVIVWQHWKYFHITGVQLEKGTTASSFEFRSYT
jgi:hypothetical protein